MTLRRHAVLAIAAAGIFLVAAEFGHKPLWASLAGVSLALPIVRFVEGAEL